MAIIFALGLFLSSLGKNANAMEFNLQAELMNAQGTMQDTGCKNMRVQQTEPYQSALQNTSENQAPTVITSGAVFRITCLDEPQPPTDGNVEPDPDVKTVFMLDAGTESDRFHNGGETSVNTTGEGVYKHQRFQKNQNLNLIYTLPVVPGQYLMRLHFFESWHGVWYRGGRVFDVIIDGITLATEVDVWHERGENTPYIMEFVIDAADTITIELLRRVQNPMISAIELQSADEGSGIVEPPEPVEPMEKPISLQWTAPTKRQDGAVLHPEHIKEYEILLCKNGHADDCLKLAKETGTQHRTSLIEGDWEARVRTVDTQNLKSPYSPAVAFSVP